MEKVNKITTILLKVTAIGAIIIVSFYFCYNFGNDRFTNGNEELTVLDKKTGTLYWADPTDREEFEITKHWIELMSFPKLLDKE